jgi:hypothetical protein
MVLRRSITFALVPVLMLSTILVDSPGTHSPLGLACSLGCLLAGGPLPSASGQEAAKPNRRDTAAGELPQPSTRSVIELEGWKIRLDDRLKEEANQELRQRALRFLEGKLAEIKLVVPAARIKDLQTITIVLDLNCGKLGAMQYHPSAGWLTANGYPAELEKCVHLPRAQDVATRRNVNEQPFVILHELAHAFHDQKLGFEDPRVMAAYDRFKQSGRGDMTLLYNGKRVKHYGLTDHKEFFAEMTESFFGFNDFYPFNRAELQESDPELFKLLTDIWIDRP